MPTITATMAMNSVVLNADFVSVEGRRDGVRSRPVLWVFGVLPVVVAVVALLGSQTVRVRDGDSRSCGDSPSLPRANQRRAFGGMIAPTLSAAVTEVIDRDVVAVLADTLQFPNLGYFGVSSQWSVLSAARASGPQLRIAQLIVGPTNSPIRIAAHIGAPSASDTTKVRNAAMKPNDPRIRKSCIAGRYPKG